MKRVRTRVGAVTTAVALGAMALATMAGPAHALGNPASPKLTFERTITSHPWAGTSTNAIDIEGLGYVPTNLTGASMWVADDNGDRIWEIDPTTGVLKSQLRGGNPSSNPANIDFTTATNVSTGQTCGQATNSGIKDGPDPTGVAIDTADDECLSRTDDFESAIYDPEADVLYVTSGNCCNAGLPGVGGTTNMPVWVNGVQQNNYPYHPTVWKLTRDGSGHLKPTSWQALPEGTDPTAAGLRPGGSIYFGKSKKIQTYNFGSNALGSQMSLAVSTDIVGLTFTDANTAFVTTATPDTSLGRTTANSDSTIQRFDISGSTWTANTTWKFPLKSIGVPGGSVDDDGMIDARDLAIVSSNGVDRFYVSDGYDHRAPDPNGDHPIYVYDLVNAPPPPPATWRYEVLNHASHFANGNSLLKYGGQFHDFYADASHASLTHSWWDGARWNVENLDGAGRNTNDAVGRHVASMQYGAQVQLFYSDATTNRLRHAWWDGARWNVETLDGAGGANGRTTDHVGGGTIAIRQYGAQVQVLYSDDTTHKLRHAWWDGAHWNFENFDTGVSLPSAVYVASTQYGTAFHVTFKTSTGTLRHDWYDGTWHTQTLDGAAGVSGHTDHNVGDFVQMTSNSSQLEIVYRDNTTSSLRLASSTAGTTSWNFDTLDGAGSSISGHTSNAVGAHISILPYGGALHLVYQDTTSGALRHAWYDGSWHAEVLDGVGSTKTGQTNSPNTGLFTAMIAYGGQLQLTYFDHANGDRLQHTWYG